SKRVVWRIKGYGALSSRNAAGNTEEQSLELDLKLSARRGSIRHTAVATYNVQQQSDTKTRDDRRAEYQYDHFFSDKWYANSVASYEQNIFQSLESRRLAGGGVG